MGKKTEVEKEQATCPGSPESEAAEKGFELSPV